MFRSGVGSCHMVLLFSQLIFHLRSASTSLLSSSPAPSRFLISSTSPLRRSSSSLTTSLVTQRTRLASPLTSPILSHHSTLYNMNPINFHSSHLSSLTSPTENDRSIAKNPSKTYANISLTSEEEILFQTLREFIHDQKIQTNIRVAGGWVRDKLLGLPVKNDIDLALENISGSQFAELLAKWNRNGSDPLHYHIIQLNPDKSKHLETASMKFLNFEIDFCGLRTENYTATSRIPNISYGTPLEDAYRRDLTINSLFYNILTNEIEDYTQRGLQDLQERRISTPLPPLITLQDDPLRCLRVVRFANRFNFSLTPELELACKDPSVHEALQRKVSSERISQELHLMMNHSNFGVHALPLLYELKLLPYIINTPERHIQYRFLESEPSTKLNWRYLWVPLRPNYDNYDIPEPIHESFDVSPVNAWRVDEKDSSNPSSITESIPLLRCVDDKGGIDHQKFCQSAVCLNLLIDQIPFQTPESSYTADGLKRLLRCASLTYPCHDIYHTNQKLDQISPRKYLREHGIKKSTMIPVTTDVCMKSLMLSHKDTENVQKIHRAAASIKPILERILRCLQHPSQEYLSPSSLLASVSFEPAVLQNWKHRDGVVANRVIPHWGPIDRLSLGLIIRETGSTFFRPSLVLACAELILEHLLGTDATSDLGTAYDKLIQELRRILSSGAINEKQAQDSDTMKEKLSHLFGQSVLLMGIIDQAINELNLSREFERPFRYNGHDVRKVLLPLLSLVFTTRSSFLISPDIFIPRSYMNKSIIVFAIQIALQKRWKIISTAAILIMAIILAPGKGKRFGYRLLNNEAVASLAIS